uniref:Ketimine reductase mu-crystallin n=1 Tax=Macrostomum lignano TaxID=282301 RepID=A0A1I8HNF4_9PLAT
MSNPVFITGPEIKALLTYEDLIPVVERSLVTYSNWKSQFHQPLREKVFTSNNGILATMPCYNAPDAALACKLVTVFPGNNDLPSHQGIVTLFDPNNGSLQALLDAEEITCIRTAAASAVASRRLLCIKRSAFAKAAHQRVMSLPRRHIKGKKITVTMATTQQQHGTPPFISGQEIKGLLSYEDLIPTVERSLITYSTKKSEFCQPMRTKVDSGSTGLLLTMPCYSAPDSALACKLVTVFPGNTDLSSHQGIVTLFDPNNGSLQALLDAEEITCIRTAAASAVASRHLAHPQSRTLALLGSGAQAFSHFEAIATLFAIECIRVHSRNPERRAALVEKIMLSAKFKPDVMKVEDCESAKAAVDQADIVCTVTSSRDPVLRADWLPRLCHVNAVGACRPDQRELDESVTSAAFLVADSRESASSESGDVIVNKATVHAELGELIAHPERFREARASRGGLTVFKSLGLGIEDAATARLVWDLRMKE